MIYYIFEQNKDPRSGDLVESHRDYKIKKILTEKPVKAEWATGVYIIEDGKWKCIMDDWDTSG